MLYFSIYQNFIPFYGWVLNSLCFNKHSGDAYWRLRTTDLEQCFSNFTVNHHHLGMLWKCRFWFIIWLICWFVRVPTRFCVSNKLWVDRIETHPLEPSQLCPIHPEMTGCGSVSLRLRLKRSLCLFLLHGPEDTDLETLLFSDLAFLGWEMVMSLAEHWIGKD